MYRIVFAISVLTCLAVPVEVRGQDNSCFSYCVQACTVAQLDERDFCLASCLRDTACVYVSGASPYSPRDGNLPVSQFPRSTLPNSTMPDSTMPGSFLR